MRLVKLSDFMTRVFPDPTSRPDARTIRAAIREGDWPANATQRVGRQYFIDLDRLEPRDEGYEIGRRLINGR